MQRCDLEALGLVHPLTRPALIVHEWGALRTWVGMDAIPVVSRPTSTGGELSLSLRRGARPDAACSGRQNGVVHSRSTPFHPGRHLRSSHGEPRVRTQSLFLAQGAPLSAPIGPCDLCQGSMDAFDVDVLVYAAAFLDWRDEIQVARDVESR